jgi:hypothetical protein
VAAQRRAERRWRQRRRERKAQQQQWRELLHTRKLAQSVVCFERGKNPDKDDYAPRLRAPNRRHTEPWCSSTREISDMASAIAHEVKKESANLRAENERLRRRARRTEATGAGMKAPIAIAHQPGR